ncbi:MAG: DUF3631 domain-containing protein [Planctomycetes bacterium]|nr:DUF3631 domain-containing protein [Planctomycetota bacterium]
MTPPANERGAALAGDAPLPNGSQAHRTTPADESALVLGLSCGQPVATGHADRVVKVGDPALPAWTPEAVATFLNSLSGGDVWVSPHHWRDNARRAEGWTAASAVFLDLDWCDADGQHAALPAEIVVWLRTAAKAGTLRDLLHGDVVYRTPRGLRLIFLFDRSCADRELYALAHLGAERVARSALGAPGLPLAAAGVAGFVIDKTSDLARVYRAPKCHAPGEDRQRDGVAVALGGEPWSFALLIAAGREGEAEREEAERAARAAATLPVTVATNGALPATRPDLGAILDGAFGSLTQDPDADALDAALRWLRDGARDLDLIALTALRTGAIKRLGALGVKAPATTVNAALYAGAPTAGAPAGGGSALVLVDPQPWTAPVDGAGLLGDLYDLSGRFMVWPGAWCRAVFALWALHSWCLDAFDHSPRLAFLSPTKRCGKSRALALLRAVVRRALPTSNVTPAALFRSIEAWAPTLLIDELDTFIKDNDDLRGVLNAGHARGGAVLRVVGDDHEPRNFNCFAATALAGIGTLPDTVADRAIIVPLRRKTPGEKVERLHESRLGDACAELRRRCMRWADDHLDTLRAADPPDLDGLNDRANDNWRLLFAIADAAGGDWPDRAREAASAAAGVETDDSEEAGVQLLGDVRAILDETGLDRIASAELARRLGEMENRPWPEWKNGKPITANQIARRLRAFGVSTRTIRTDTGTPKGYLRFDLEDAFTRYPAPIPPSQSATPPQPYCHKGLEAIPNRNMPPGVADRDFAPKPQSRAGNGTCGGVADRNPGNGRVDGVSCPA